MNEASVAIETDRAIRISEIFGPTIQGEGEHIGCPTIFVRTGGCDYVCSWCDTLFAVDTAYKANWIGTKPAQVMEEIERLSQGRPLLVTLSGGNPAIQPCGPLIELGQSKGYTFAIETQGSVAKPWFAQLDYITFSPKPPSSNYQTERDKLQKCIEAAGSRPRISLKFVVFDDDDYAYAKLMAAEYPYFPAYLQPGNHAVDEADEQADSMAIRLERLRWLADKVVEDGWHEARVLPQLHVLMWGNERGK